MPTNNQTFIIPPIGDSPEQVSRFATASPWPKESVAFTMANLSYPFPHTHEYYEVLVIFSGSIVHTVNGTQFTMHSGDCCLLRFNDCHHHTAGISKDTTEQFLAANFMCTKEFFDRVTSIYPAPPFPSVEENPSPLSFHLSSSYINKLRKLCLLLQTPLISPTPENITICTSLVAEFIHTCIRSHATSKADGYPSWLQSLIISLQNPENFTKKLIDIASDIPYSYSFIQKQFRQYVGIPPIEYFNSIKLTYAKEVLTNSETSIISIAGALGFESPAHFNHLFKRTFNITPTAYRKQTTSTSGGPNNN